MQTRPGFARLLPLMALTGLAAGTVALLASARPMQAPPRRHSPIVHAVFASHYDGGCSDVTAPCPSSVVDYYGKRWELADMPGRLLVCLDLRGAEWFGVDLHRARFVGCDFRGADLRSADFRRARMWRCDLRGADLTGAKFSRACLIAATYDTFTRWPTRFNPQAHGAWLDE
jgi:hypothetical protein